VHAGICVYIAKNYNSFENSNNPCWIPWE